MSNHATAMCAVFVDELVRFGVRFAFVAPGSRSTPLALALAARAELHTEVVLDERSAAFMALGVGAATGLPAVVLTTSGTATTHLHGAVAEADLAEVPLLVCTADRPPELHGVGAAQTIDQRGLFGPAVRAELDLGVPDEANRGAWRSLAARAAAETIGRRPGPVQVNLAFREPLVGSPAPQPVGRADGAAWHRRIVGADGPPPAVAAELARAWAGRRGVLVVGDGLSAAAGAAPVAATADRAALDRTAAAADGVAAVLALAHRLGWPVLADHRSGCRIDDPAVVAHADALLRHPPTAAALRPEVVVSLGAPPASKVVGQWLAGACRGGEDDGCDEPVATWVVVNRAGSWWDPDRLAALIVESSPGAFAQALLDAFVLVGGGSSGAASQRIGADSLRAPDAWMDAWRSADDLASSAIEAALQDDGARPPSEPSVARLVLERARRHGAGALVVSSSMPVRDLEWYGGRLPAEAAPLRVLANRGANGIDGVVATALGAACAAWPRPVWLLIGDLALLHDSTSLLNAVHRRARVRLVVVDNGGGGIFSFLPQAAQVAPDRFEQLFGTTQRVAVEALLAAHGIPTSSVAAGADLPAALDGLAAVDEPLAAVVVHVVDRSTNVEVHDRVHRAVARALER
ncbi:MAG: 2-succinyl-5-enolpyruvyl-6-hydroxy-3-cyclohexene-1-carboxylic-acid synthase [Acidimicrobiia bacterium]